MPQLTLIGKLVFFGVPLVLIIILVSLLSKPAPKEITPSFLIQSESAFSFPLKENERASFDKNALLLKDFCDVFSTGYKFYHGDTNEGEAAKPIRFTVLLPEDPEKSPYYYENPTTGTSYWPAYPVLPLSKKGMLSAQAALQENADGIPSCNGETAATGGLIMLAFAKGRVPLTTDRLLSVRALSYWISLGINPNQTSNPGGEATGSAPVYLAEEFETLTPSQAIYQASRVKHLHTNIRTDTGLININKIEWSNAQTRIWVKITNTTSKPIYWDADVPQLIPQGGPQAGQPLEVTVPQDNDDSIDSTITGEDPILQSSLEILPGQTVPGFISFAPVDPTQSLEFTFPDVFLADSDQDPRLLRLSIPAISTPSDNESDRHLLRRGQG